MSRSTHALAFRVVAASDVVTGRVQVGEVTPGLPGRQAMWLFDTPPRLKDPPPLRTPAHPALSTLSL